MTQGVLSDTAGIRTRGRLATLVLALALALPLLLAGCGSGATRGVMRMQLSDDAADRTSFIPPPPSVPRYWYAGELHGERNFREDRAGMSAVKKAFIWIVGLFEEEENELGLVRPQNGVVDGLGRILVTDVGKPGVFVFDEAGGVFDYWGEALPSVGFLAPTGIVAAPNQETWVADADLAVVVRLDKEGRPLGRIGEGVLVRPTGLARDPVTGRLFVADTRASDIKVFDAEGRLIQTIGNRGEGQGELNTPTYLAIADGLLYVSDTFNGRIQVFDTDGNYLRQFGSRGTLIGQMPRPKGVATDEEGNVYVVESYFDHLLIFNQQAEFLLGIDGTGRPGGDFYLPAGVWSDDKNRIFVADMFRGRVVILQFLGARDG